MADIKTDTGEHSGTGDNSNDQRDNPGTSSLSLQNPPTQHTSPAVSENNRIYAYSVKLPTFWPTAPEAYFEQVEATFRTNRISVSRTKYDYLIQALPPSVATDVLDVMRRCKDLENPYEEMKAALVRRNTLSESARLEQLLSGTEMGDRTPSAFYRSMMNISGSTTSVNDDLVRQLWMRRLPSTLEIMLKGFEKEPIDTILKIADTMYETQKRQPSLAEVNSRHSDARYQKLESEISELKRMISSLNFHDSNGKRSERSRSRSRSRTRDRTYNPDDKTCYYHQMYDSDARKCKGPPCPKAHLLKKNSSN